MEAIILSGIQGAGKSTYCKDRYWDTHIRINYDMLRTRHRETLMIAACLSGKQPYIVDSTNSTKAERARYVGPAKAAGFRVIGIEFVIPVSLAMQRNGQREGKRRVPDKAIYITVAKREPLVSEEGFDELWVATVTTEGIQIKEKISAL